MAGLSITAPQQKNGAGELHLAIEGVEAAWRYGTSAVARDFGGCAGAEWHPMQAFTLVPVAALVMPLEATFRTLRCSASLFLVNAANPIRGSNSTPLCHPEAVLECA